MNKNKKLVAALLICVFMVTALTGCGKERMMFGTGGTAGTYYAYGGIIAQYMTNYAGVKVTAVSTGGSTVNIQSMQDGDYQMGFAQTDVMTYAWDGTKSFESYGENHDFRVLGGLYAETVQLITKVGCFDVDDLFLNTVGVMLGYLCYYISKKMIGHMGKR